MTVIHVINNITVTHYTVTILGLRLRLIQVVNRRAVRQLDVAKGAVPVDDEVGHTARGVLAMAR